MFSPGRLSQGMKMADGRVLGLILFLPNVRFREKGKKMGRHGIAAAARE